MSWLGYFAFGGEEIINVARTEAYARHDGTTWFTPVYRNANLHRLLGDSSYRAPLQDDECPWVDPDEPDSYGFYGFYPLDVTGLESSSRTSTIVENVGDGGNAGRLRHGTKQIVFNGLLMGDTDAAVEAGMRWLRATLLSGADYTCRGTSCSGSELTYFEADPVFDPDYDGDCAAEQLRTLYNVTVNNGPTVTAKHTFKDGSAYWTVTFTAVAANPFEFGQPVQILTNAFGLHTGDQIDLDGYKSQEVSCPSPNYKPVFDPLCPDLILPPSSPPVPLGCYDPPKNWLRHVFRIPADAVKVWTEMVPTWVIHTSAHEVRNMRIRLWKDPLGTKDPDEHPCGFCADYLVTYVPPGGALVLDGRNRTVEFTDPGQSRRADGLVFSSNRTPLAWPELSCGYGYVGTIDLLQTQVKPRVDLLLYPKAL